MVAMDNRKTVINCLLVGEPEGWEVGTQVSLEQQIYTEVEKSWQIIAAQCVSERKTPTHTHTIPWYWILGQRVALLAAPVHLLVWAAIQYCHCAVQVHHLMWRGYAISGFNSPWQLVATGEGHREDSDTPALPVQLLFTTCIISGIVQGTQQLLLEKKNLVFKLIQITAGISLLNSLLKVKIFQW